MTEVGDIPHRLEDRLLATASHMRETELVWSRDSLRRIASAARTFKGRTSSSEVLVELRKIINGGHQQSSTNGSDEFPTDALSILQ